jgi:hypothetical protein
VSQQELLKRVVEALTRVGIDYMVTGSVVSSLQGEPRATHDVDLVVSVDQSRVGDIVSAFPPPEFYLDEGAVREAIESGGMFNLIDVQEGDKVDFWLLTEDPFDRSRFARKYEEEVVGLRLMVSRPEDTILQKLKWSKLSGGSEKSFVDALRVYEVQSRDLDREYLRQWAERLGAIDLWERILAEAEEL